MARLLRNAVPGLLGRETSMVYAAEYGGSFDRNIRDREELGYETQSTHRNPARRGVVGHPEERGWSSVHAWLGSPRPYRPACERPPG